MDEYAILVFRDQPFSDEEQLAFAQRLDGQLHSRTGSAVLGNSRLGHEALSDISNVDEQGEILKSADRRRMYGLGNRLWHTDASFQDPPGRYSMLSARIVPPVGADTEFADMRAAYDALDAGLKGQIEDLVCEHSLMYSRGSLGMLDYSEEERAMFRPVRQRLVRTHPVTARKSLYLSSHAGGIVGMPMPEARILLRDLTEHATQSRFVYVHTWRLWDLVMWDNRQMMHRVRRYDESQPRDMRRTTVAGDAPTTAQVPA